VIEITSDFQRAQCRSRNPSRAYESSNAGQTLLPTANRRDATNCETGHEGLQMKHWMMAVVLAMLWGFEPEVGSDTWCDNMVDKDKGNWTANDATEFARSCVFKTYGSN
jgi:hypothetical protein